MKKVLDRILELKGSQSTTAFARSIGLNQQTMDRYIKGREPPIGVIQQLCMVYEVSADWLLGLPERGRPNTATASGPGSIAAVSNTVTIGQQDPAGCRNCKYKRLAEALKAVQMG